jgi:hypothetical protein
LDKKQRTTVSRVAICLQFSIIFSNTLSISGTLRFSRDVVQRPELFCVDRTSCHKIQQTSGQTPPFVLEIRDCSRLAQSPLQVVPNRRAAQTNPDP